MLKNGFYNVVTGIVKAGATVVTVPVLLRLLGLEEYGVWALVSSVLGVLVLAEAGLSVSTTVFVSEDLAKKDSKSLSQTLTVITGAMLVLATTAALSLYFGADALIRFFPKLEVAQQQAVVAALKVGAIAVWVQLLQQICVGLEQSYQQYRLLNTLDVLQLVCLNLGWVVVAWRGGQTVALAQWQAFVAITTFLGHILLVRSLVHHQFINIQWNRQQAFKVIRYSLINWVSTLGMVLFSRGDRLVVGSIFGSSQLGIYVAITEVSALISAFATRAIQPIIPSISHLISTKSPNTLVLSHAKQAVQLHAWVATTCGAVLLILSPIIAKVMLLEGYTNVTLITFQISAVIITLCSLGTTGHFILLSMKHTVEPAILYLSSGALTLALIAWGGIHFGLIGAVSGNIGWLVTLALPVIAIGRLQGNLQSLTAWLKVPVLAFIGLASLAVYHTLS